MKKAVVLALAAALACSSQFFIGTVHAAETQAVQTEKTGINKEAASAQQVYGLTLNTDDYTAEIMHYQGRTVAFRAYENKVYVAHPVDAAFQSMNIYVPEDYFDGKTINGYTAETAPIFLPNTVGGYMPGKAGTPMENDSRNGGPNAILTALARGYVVAAPAVRGRTSQDASGSYIGKAPACIVDMKAAVRYLRHNKGVLPGDTEKIISNGTSAGGALSALIGVTGDSKDYEPYLKKLGAADERDDIYAASVYCPITNLEHADMAYEWIFSDVHTYYQGNMNNVLTGIPSKEMMAGTDPAAVMSRPDNAPAESITGTELTDKQIEAAQELKAKFPAYVNSLKLHDQQGNPLLLNKDGTGSFADYIQSVYMDSAQQALNEGSDLKDADWAVVDHGTVTGMNLAAYAQWVTRLKGTPAFDAFDGTSGENDEFGDSQNNPKHFTNYSYRHNDGKHRAMADKRVIRLMNPMNYIGKKGVKTASYWRIRHGAKDRDTSLAIPAMLALELENNGYSVDFASPWGKGHAGDYDLDELFDWTDQISKQ